MMSTLSGMAMPHRLIARHCKDHGVSDAEAFLHERLGDMDAALRLYLADIRSSWQALQEALEAGRLQVLAGQQGRAGQGRGRGSDMGLGQGGQSSGALGGWLEWERCMGCTVSACVACATACRGHGSRCCARRRCW